MRHTINLAVFLTCFTVLCIVSIWWVVPAVARVAFDHGTHQEYIADEPCTTCHLEGADAIVPSQETCLQCHDRSFVEDVAIPAPATHGPLWGLNHRPFAKNAAADCNACHQQSDCL